MKKYCDMLIEKFNNDFKNNEREIYVMSLNDYINDIKKYIDENENDDEFDIVEYNNFVYELSHEKNKNCIVIYCVNDDDALYIVFFDDDNNIINIYESQIYECDYAIINDIISYYDIMQFFALIENVSFHNYFVDETNYNYNDLTKKLFNYFSK